MKYKKSSERERNLYKEIFSKKLVLCLPLGKEKEIGAVHTRTHPTHTHTHTHTHILMHTHTHTKGC